MEITIKQILQNESSKFSQDLVARGYRIRSDVTTEKQLSTQEFMISFATSNPNDFDGENIAIFKIRES